jgi:hypothetical protein
MAESFSVNTDQVALDLRRWADKLTPAIVQGTAAFGSAQRDLIASNRVPIVTGTLARSVVDEPVDDSDLAGRGIGMGEGVPYAGWIEFGGSRGRPHVPEGRYIDPTLVSHQDQFIKATEDAIASSIETFPWSKPT